MKPSDVARWLGCAAALAATPAVAAPTSPPSAVAPASPAAEHVARFALVLEGPHPVVDECGGRLALERAVEERLERPVFVEDVAAADTSLVVTIDPVDGGQWRARIGEHDRSGSEVGHRDVVIDAERCERGVDTLAIVLAIMVGPPRRIAGPAPEPTAGASSSREAAPATSPGLREKSATPAAKPERLRWGIAPTAALVAGSGILPGVSLGVEGGVLVHTPLPRLSFIARGEFWPSRSTGARPEVDVARYSGALLGCWLGARVHPATFTLCTGVGLGWITASAPTLDEPVEQGGVTRLLLDVPLEGRVGFELSPAHHRVRVEPYVATQLAVLLRRDRFTFQNRIGQEILLHQAAPIALQASAGVAVHFF